MAVYSSGTLNVAAQAAYPSTPQVTIPFPPTSIAVVVEEDPATGYGCVVSFDGTNDAGTLLAGRPSAALEWRGQSYTKVWIKRAGVSAGTINVRVMADDGVI